MPAVTPVLRRILVVILALVALLGANSVYLVAVTLAEYLSGDTYQNFSYQYMFLGHLVLGLLLIVPFLIFCGFHIRNAWRRKNRRAVWIGYCLFSVSFAVLVSGLLLTRMGPMEVRDPSARTAFYWTHVITPLVAVWLYWLHRLAGPPIKWKVGAGYLALVGCAGIAAVVMHQADPRAWYQVGSPEGARYFEPSLARTSNGKFIPAQSLSNDAYCEECHADAHRGWAESAHRFSSFNNPAYLASIRETRAFSVERDGTVRRSRWCAGCHDPVPFFSGEFDDPNFDDIHNPTAQAGITCTACHAISNVNSTRGNADYTIEEPLHYPFAYSDSSILRWINRQLVKAKPSFHKKTFLKPFHESAEFCSVCHKVHLPKALNDYKFLRGQNHYDNFLLSGVSGHGARSFYYPDVAHSNCNGCHMPLVESDDFGANFHEGNPQRSIHDHLFLGANTALPYWRGALDFVERHQDFFRDSLRVDIFGLRPGGSISDKLIAPLRPELPRLIPGETYLLETVIRTLSLGHLFTQGTVDSNEVWLEVTISDGQNVIGSSGTVDDGTVDPWAHFVNAFVLDREGNRISRRNAQDIFVPLYDHQIPPGAGQSVHYRFTVPEDIENQLKVEVKLQYRKFDREYVDFIASSLPEDGPALSDSELRPSAVYPPVTTIASDAITLQVTGRYDPLDESLPGEIPAWQRWNDYGIGLLLKGTGELRQAEEAFQQVENLGRYDGPLNLARVYFREGRLDEAVSAIKRAALHDDPAPPPWTLSWLSGLVNRQQGYLESAEENFQAVLSAPTREMRKRGFDFRLDYEVINLLGHTKFELARRLRGEGSREAREIKLRSAVEQFHKTLIIDAENVDAHFSLQQLHTMLDEPQLAQKHRELHLKYKPDDNARDRAVAAARKKYPAANQASEMVVIYDLQREGKAETRVP